MDGALSINRCTGAQAAPPLSRLYGSHRIRIGLDWRHGAYRRAVERGLGQRFAFA
jgi:hypothetical protein